jgi:hypothetical protein
MIILVNLVVPVTLLPHDYEVLGGLLNRSLVMEQLVEVVMDNFTDVYHAILVQLYLRLEIKLDPGGMNETQVTNVVLTI